MSRDTPSRPVGFDIIAVVTNTFFWRPDWPTTRYLKHADFRHLSVIAIVAGGGNTGQAREILAKALQGTGGDVRGIRELWISRPNEPHRPRIAGQSNRSLALEIARQFAAEAGAQLQ